MEQHDKNMIEKYFTGELSAAERALIEQRVSEDEAFRNGFEEFRSAMDAVRIMAREELRERFRKRDIHLDRSVQRPGKGLNTVLLISSIAATLLLLLWLFRGREIAPAESIITRTDSLDANIPVRNPDTLVQKESYPMATVDKTKEQAEKTPARAKNRGKELFAANFEAYEDASLDPVSRGDENLSPLDKFRKHYWEKDYKEVVNDYQVLPEHLKQNESIQFFYANALLSTGKVRAAKEILSESAISSKSPYGTEVLFYLAMCHIYDNEMKEAHQLLEKYIQQPDAAKVSIAKRLLNGQ